MTNEEHSRIFQHGDSSLSIPVELSKQLNL